MTRRSKGIAFLLLGCILLAIAGVWYAYNIIEDKNAGNKAADILGKLEYIESSDITDNTSSAVITVDGDAFCGKVIIERLGIELPVYDEWDYSRLKSAPCRYAGNITSNDIIIAAHNYKSHFGPIDNLKKDDIIKFVDAFGNEHNYAVCEITTLDGTAVSDMQSGGWDFTLFTCTLSGEQRVTVRCERKQ